MRLPIRASSHLSGRRVSEFGIVVAILLVGILLRARHLEIPAVWADEAESGINALTVLQHGYPADAYLDLPIFENTLVSPWPESEEYEFKDSSYSERGMATYHGWLPIYAIAASLAVAGVEPDETSATLEVRRSEQEMRRRAGVIRRPSVVFGAVFLLAIYLTGRLIHGAEAGTLAMLIAAVEPTCISFAREARYYSATLALSMLSFLAIWLLAKNGRWRDYALWALVIVLLFHTNLLAFVVACLLSLILAPSMRQHEAVVRKLGVVGAIVAAGTLPWIWLTGFALLPSEIPAARALLEFPGDYLLYLGKHPELLLLVLGVAGELVLAALLAQKLPARVTQPLRRMRAPAGLLLLFLGLGYAAFLFLMPAPSFWFTRLTMLMIGPAILLAAVAVATHLQIASPRRSVPATLILAGGAIVLGWTSFPWPADADPRGAPMTELIEHLRSVDLRPGTRIYSLPSRQLPLTFYTGLPVQSVAPIRRKFLDEYPGEVLMLETASRHPHPPRRTVQEHAAAAGQQLSEAEVREWRRKLAIRAVQEDLRSMVASMAPALPEVPAWGQALLDEHRRELEERGGGYQDYAAGNPAMFNAYPVTSEFMFWPVFFYRFVEPEQRWGSRVNYSGRIRGSHATILDSSWVIYRCPPPRGNDILTEDSLMIRATPEVRELPRSRPWRARMREEKQGEDRS